MRSPFSPCSSALSWVGPPYQTRALRGPESAGGPPSWPEASRSCAGSTLCSTVMEALNAGGSPVARATRDSSSSLDSSSGGAWAAKALIPTRAPARPRRTAIPSTSTREPASPRPSPALLVIRSEPPRDRDLVGITCVPSSTRLGGNRSEEHTSELQSRQYLVCRLL